MKKALLFILLPLCILPARVQAQDKIDKSKKALTESESVNNKASTAQSTSSSGENSVLVNIIADAFMYTIGGVVYYGLLGDYGNEDHLYNDLTKYPYYEEEAGNYYKPKFGEGNVYVFRLDLKDKFMYNADHLFGNHLEAKMRPSHIFSLKADYYQLFEFLKLEGTSNSLSLFYLNFAYDRLRCERFNLGWTVGASYIGSGVNQAGFSYGLNAEYFLKKRVSFAAGAKWSRINGQPVNAYEAEVRVHKKSHFITLGGEHLKIAAPNYDFITLGAGIYF